MTNPTLDELVAEAIKRPMTPEDIWEQRVSFCYGMLSFKSKVTKDEVRAILKRHYGKPA
jgi:hypothetical protein